MTNVKELELWRNIIASGVTWGVCTSFADSGSPLWFLVGLGYAWFFEYFYHRYVGHTELFQYAAKKHRSHHSLWRGCEVVSWDRTRGELAEDWYFFPTALLAHFVVGKLIFGCFPNWMLLAFYLFYVQFEVLHWATHMWDNPVDRVLFRTPVVKHLRALQITWHLEHHEIPKRKYNFTGPPFVGDILFRSGE